jgi:glycosyltransferase involved in cell wall biosynthesis
MHLPVSVLMSVYNAESYLRDAIDSILQQTFKEFEFVIIDDASSDNSKQIIQSYLDKRIKLIENEQNLGLTRSLNKGIGYCEGEFIARMDADDVAAPHRLKEQWSFMREHPEVGVCGSWVYYSSQGGSQVLWKYPLRDEDIRIELLLKSRIAHPSAMIRKKVLTDHHLSYDTEFTTSQDYDLWVRMSHYCKLANLPEPLLTYRYHTQSISSQKQILQKRNTKKIRLGQLAAMNIIPSTCEWKAHLEVINRVPPPTTAAFYRRYQWLLKLKRANESNLVYNSISFCQFLAREWMRAVSELQFYNLGVLRIVLKSTLPFYSYMNKLLLLKVSLRCVKGSIMSRKE